MANSNGRNVIAQGRLVWILGDSLWTGKAKVDDRTNQPVIDSKTGKQVIEYGFGLAIPKSILTNENMGVGGPAEIWAAMHQEALSLYPSGQLPPGFAMKFKDGDTAVDQNGVPYSQRDGYAGHIVLTCVTRIPLQVFKHQGAYIQITEGVKCGDYVTVQLAIKAHTAEGQSKPGLYVNPSMVLFTMAGEPIIGASKNPETLFGANAPVTASWMVPQTTPQVPANFGNMAAAAQAPAVPQFPGVPGMQAPPQMQQPPVQQTQPHYGVLPQVHQPQAQVQQAAGFPVGNFPPAPNAGTMGVPQAPAMPTYPSNQAMGVPGVPTFPVPGYGQ